MTPLIPAIFLASVLGSFHCAGMCGAFLAVAVNDAGNLRRHAALQSAYHGGRLISYLTLGIAAGMTGRLLDLGGRFAGIRSGATVLAALTIILFASVTLLRTLGVRCPRVPAPKWLARLAAPIYRFAMHRPPMGRAIIIGLSTTLLPCGWLYAFVITAASTASPASAAAVMLTFWLGTLPLMISFGAGLRSFLGPLQRRLPVAMCLLMLFAGLYTLFARARLDPVALGAAINPRSTVPVPGSAACCDVASGEQLQQRVLPSSPGTPGEERGGGLPQAGAATPSRPLPSPPPEYQGREKERARTEPAGGVLQ